MLFEWDKKKNKSNIEKHFVDFEDAKNVFNDYHRVDSIDNRKEYGEVRYQSIGLVNDVLLFIIWTRRNLKTRIISARSAKSIERKRYYEK